MRPRRRCVPPPVLQCTAVSVRAIARGNKKYPPALRDTAPHRSVRRPAAPPEPQTPFYALAIALVVFSVVLLILLILILLILVLLVLILLVFKVLILFVIVLFFLFSGHFSYASFQSLFCPTFAKITNEDIGKKGKKILKKKKIMPQSNRFAASVYFR